MWVRSIHWEALPFVWLPVRTRFCVLRRLSFLNTPLELNLLTSRALGLKRVKQKAKLDASRKNGPRENILLKHLKAATLELSLTA